MTATKTTCCVTGCTKTAAGYGDAERRVPYCSGHLAADRMATAAMLAQQHSSHWGGVSQGLADARIIAAAEVMEDGTAVSGGRVYEVAVGTQYDPEIVAVSDRAAFLDKIAEDPKSDLNRLVYCDWLDEFGRGDLDAATAEFIRLSCTLRPSPVMPRAAYEWLEGNWRRLVPVLVDRIRTNWSWRCGCEIQMGFRLRSEVDEKLAALPTRRLNLHFRRGFLFRLEVWSEPAAYVVVKSAMADQPLVDVRGTIRTLRGQRIGRATS